MDNAPFVRMHRLQGERPALLDSLFRHTLCQATQALGPAQLITAGINDDIRPTFESTTANKANNMLQRGQGLATAANQAIDTIAGDI